MVTSSTQRTEVDTGRESLSDSEGITSINPSRYGDPF